ncbi:MAG: efflux RND transporter periplasmic adaptor subunit [Isosphaeraceae bacterium]
MEQTNRLSRDIGTLLEFGSSANLTDGQLLERFLTRESETAERAFALLVERHGPMVMRVCRGILADPHDAEDAFQATFLVLVKKARALWVQDSLGPWIHQVALRTASHSRAAALRRRRHEASAARAVDEAPRHEIDDLAPILHEEIGRLPERFRVPVILCDLQGIDQEQAARHLGCPVGTIKSRLSRARQRLRERLLRRGFAPGVVAAGVVRPPGIEDVLSEALVSATARAACRFAASRTVLDGTAVLLAQGVLSAMSMTRWWKAACLLIVAGATVSGAGLLSGRGSRAVEPDPQEKGRPEGDMPVAAATRGPFRLVISDRGTVEPTKAEDLVSRLQEARTLLSIVPEGTKVKKGDTVGELDSSLFQEQLKLQMPATHESEAALQAARLSREMAELALKEYEEGIFLSELGVARGDIKLNEAALVKADARLERMRRAKQKLDAMRGRQAPSSVTEILAEVDLEDRFDAAEQALLRQKVSYELAQGKLHLLENYTKVKTTKALRVEVEKARSAERSRELALQVEREKQSRIEKQINSCRLVAPFDGLVTHADGPSRAGERVTIEPGSLIGVGQLVARVVDLDAPMRLNAKVGEAMIDQVRPGQRAHVRIDAFPNQSFTGVVTDFAPRPDPQSYFARNVKVYSTLVRLENGNKSLRPGMTGHAEITIVEHPDVLTVPFDAILHYEDEDHVAVKMPDGGFERRKVVLGEGDPETRRVVIKEGLKPGEQVALKPIDLLSEHEKRQKGIGEPTRPARKSVDPNRPLPR